jgi:DNA-binding transcriptional LysR family regulator
VRSAQIAGVAALAAAGLGPAIVPSNIVGGAARAAVRPLAPPRARELFAFTRTGWSPLARAFLDTLGEQPWPRRERDTIPVS